VAQRASTTLEDESEPTRIELGTTSNQVSQSDKIYRSHYINGSHAITCLHMHHRLLMPSTVSDPLSYLLNLLPTSRKKPTIQRRSKYSAWFIRWPIICQILHELDYLHHDKTVPEIPPLGTKLLHWFSFN
jgi:hypothetical protein